MSSKKGFAMPIVIVVTLFTFVSVAIFLKNYLLNVSDEFMKDLASTRGYWASYGAKELDTNVIYQYYSLDGVKSYQVEAFKRDGYEWNISDKDLEKRLWLKSLKIEGKKTLYKRVVTNEAE